MTSEKGVERHKNIMNMPIMTSDESMERHNNVIKEITTKQDLMLLAMRRDPNITIAELSDLVCISTRNVARNIKKLQEIGLLERVGSRKDGKWIVLN